LLASKISGFHHCDVLSSVKSLSIATFAALLPLTSVANAQMTAGELFRLHDQEVERACELWARSLPGAAAMANRNNCIDGEAAKRSEIMAMWNYVPTDERRKCIDRMDRQWRRPIDRSYYYRYLWDCMAHSYRPPPEQPHHLPTTR
jgi:hypothetical protein